MKCTSAICHLTYDVVLDALDEYLQMGLTTTRTALEIFCSFVMEIFGAEYLQKPTVTDVEKLYTFHEQKHRHDHGPNPFILLEVVASHDLWIWHAFFGVLEANNDINIIHPSPLFGVSEAIASHDLWIWHAGNVRNP
ncbi:ALP1-like protein isoform X1 [Tanacetum coccineum]